MVGFEFIDRCPICGGKGSFWKDSDGNGQYVRADKCSDCGVGYLNPMPFQKSLEHYYASGEYILDHDGGTYAETDRAGLLLTILRGFDINPKRCLDIGCARGILLGAIKKNYSAEILGYDLHKADDCTIEEIVHKQEDITGKFDLIFCIQTLEHLLNPLGKLEWMKSLLQDGGTMIVDVPYDKKVYLPHMFYYDRFSIRYLLERAGLKYVGLDFNRLEVFMIGEQYGGMKTEKYIGTLDTSKMNEGLYS